MISFDVCIEEARKEQKSRTRHFYSFPGFLLLFVKLHLIWAGYTIISAL